MIISGTYRLTYTVDGKPDELLVEVKLKQIEGLIKPLQNVYYGVVHVNSALYLDKDLEHCVDAKSAAEELGYELRDELKKKLRSQGKSFRFKKEEIK